MDVAHMLEQVEGKGNVDAWRIHEFVKGVFVKSFY